MDLTSVRFVTNCVKLFWFDCMICGNSLPASFRSDCVLKYELIKLAFSLSSVYIISFSFSCGSDALSLVDINDFRVLHQSLLLKLWLEVSLFARLSKWVFLEDRYSLVVSFLSRLYWSQCCCNCVRLALS